ncbi:MAG: hypothetical protein NC253_00690 [Ruminococcus sp.]|nr:hypothetical protein [Ruminococcus sp.]
MGKLKFILAAILSLSLCGCREETPALDTVSETVSETAASETTSAKTETSADTTTTVTTETSEEREEIPEEQAALEKLITDAAGDKEGYAIQSPLFGDFDGDGKNELIALYENIGDTEVWFASGGKAERLVSGYWRTPEIVTSCGRAFVKLEFGGYATSSYSVYYLLENSSVSEYGGVPEGEEVYPYGGFGDFTAMQSAYDGYTEFYKDDPEGEVSTGHTHKTYWYYSMNDRAYEYTGRILTEDEFLEYEGAREFLGKAAADGEKVGEIIKRGCGIITVNLDNVDETDEYIFTTHRNKTLKYRNGKIFETADDYDDGGNYVFDENVKQTYFEDFCEMIYDAAEGDGNSFIRERFYGNIGGKNALYAYYGTDENFSLWYADKDGAKKVTDDISLFTADGDVLMRNSGEYFAVKNGKSKKLDTMNAEEFSYLSDGVFTGYVTVGYTDSTRSEETRKLYWFRYKDGEISDIEGVDITEEDLLAYGGGRAALDEIAARGGDLVNIVRRDNGIININYALHNQTVTKRFFMTLEVGADGKLTDITPTNGDGTPDNAGWYLHSLKIKN